MLAQGGAQYRAGTWLYKILFYFEAFVHESIMLLSPPTCTARTIEILLHVYCAIYARPLTPPFFARHPRILVMAISCKGQAVESTEGVSEIWARENFTT